MKTVVITSLFVLGAMATPAVACDMHGGGGFHGGFGMKWQPYTPTPSYDDSRSSQYVSTADEINTAKTVAAKKRPSFSNAAKTASARAKLKLASASGKTSIGSVDSLDDASSDERGATVISDGDVFDLENLKQP